MAPHTTTEMRERMVVWRSEFGKTDSEIAALLVAVSGPFAKFSGFTVNMVSFETLMRSLVVAVVL